MIDINFNPSRKDLRLFSILETIFFAIVSFMVYQKTGSAALPISIFATAAVVGGIGWFVPTLMRWIYIGWMLAVFPIGWTVSHFLMAAIYFLVVTPVGIMMRLCGRDPLERKLDRAAESYWKSRSPRDGTDHYFRQF